MTPGFPEHPPRAHDDEPFDCAAVDARLAAYVDDEDVGDVGGPGALTPAERARMDAHVGACTRCEALVADLRALTTHAAALPPLAPTHDLWPAIAARLDAARDHAPAGEEDVRSHVLPFRQPRPRRTAAVAPAAAARRWRLAAAAVVIAAASSGATYLAVARSAAPAVAAAERTPPAGTLAARPPAPEQTAPGASPESPGRPGAPDTAGVRHSPSRLALGVGARTSAEQRARPERPDVAVQPVTARVDDAVPGAADYDREIALLRAAVAERRGDLDSATVAVLARNLRVIDAAIAASRAALAHDPRSPFLGDQLTRALGQKVELLRTAALLPRT